MEGKVLVLAVAVLVAAVGFAYAHGVWGGKDVGVKGWKGVGESVAGCRGGWFANVTLYSATRQLSISGDGINVALVVDVVNRNASSPYGRIVYGAGTVQLGGVTYTVKSVAGGVGPRGVHLNVYTGSELIVIRYLDGRYYAVVKPLGAAGLQRYNGTATFTVS